MTFKAQIENSKSPSLSLASSKQSTSSKAHVTFYKDSRPRQAAKRAGLRVLPVLASLWFWEQVPQSSLAGTLGDQGGGVEGHQMRQA